MGAELTQYLTDWYAWATAPKLTTQFDPTLGLCDNAPTRALRDELASLFELEFGDTPTSVMPFDTLGSYITAGNQGTQHLNPKRLAWVRSKIMKFTIITFLTDYYNWATSGAPLHDVFKRNYGLCTNVSNYSGVHLDDEAILYDELQTMLEQDFKDDTAYPFGGYDVYRQERWGNTIHLNADRLAWIKSKITPAQDMNRVLDLLLGDRTSIEGKTFMVLNETPNDYGDLKSIPAGTQVRIDFGGHFGIYGFAVIDGIIRRLRINLQDLHNLDWSNV